MKRFLSSAAIGLFAFAGAAEAQTVLLNDPVFLDSTGPVTSNSAADSGTTGYQGTPGGTFTLSQASTVVIDAVTSTNSNITGQVYIQTYPTPAFGGGVIEDGNFALGTGGIGGGSIDSATATLGAGTYDVTYLLDNRQTLPVDGPASPAENLVDIQVDSVSAPEIDPASAASGLTLLAGALLVLRGRRRTTSAVSFA
jgi:hypothetical protein